MNILFLTTHLNAGGITSYVMTLTKGLVKKGHIVHILSSGGDMEKAFIGAGAKLMTVDIRTKSEINPQIYLALKPISRYIQKHDIELLHTHTRVTQVIGTMLSKRVKRPHISTCHGFFKTRLSRRMFPCWGDAVIAISSVIKEHLIKDFKVPYNRVFLITSGVDCEEFKMVDEEQRRKQRGHFHLDDHFIIGNVARLSDVKGPDILIEAMGHVKKEIPGCKLVLVGEGKMEDALRKKVRVLGLEECVRFFSVVNQTSKILPLFDIFVMPSRQEGLGLSILEAQASGLPVVASRVGGIPGLIKDGETGILVEPLDPKALAGAVVDLYSNRSKLNNIGKAARASVENTHNAADMVSKTEDLYQKIVY